MIKAAHFKCGKMILAGGNTNKILLYRLYHELYLMPIRASCMTRYDNIAITSIGYAVLFAFNSFTSFRKSNYVIKFPIFFFKRVPHINKKNIRKRKRKMFLSLYFFRGVL